MFEEKLTQKSIELPIARPMKIPKIDLMEDSTDIPTTKPNEMPNSKFKLQLIGTKIDVSVNLLRDKNDTSSDKASVKVVEISNVEPSDEIIENARIAMNEYLEKCVQNVKHFKEKTFLFFQCRLCWSYPAPREVMMLDHFLKKHSFVQSQYIESLKIKNLLAEWEENVKEISIKKEEIDGEQNYFKEKTNNITSDINLNGDIENFEIEDKPLKKDLDEKEDEKIQRGKQYWKC